MSSQKYQWLLFDLDNTILDFTESSRLAFHSVYDTFKTDKAIKDVFRLYKGINHSVWQEREAGLLTHTELKTKRWKLLFDVLGLPNDPLTTNDIYFEEIKINPVFVDGAESLLQSLHKKWKMMMITNGLSEVQWSRIELTGIRSYFEHVIISDEVDCAKPDPKFFDLCYDLIGKPDKDKVLVIGDTPMSDIKGGNDYGFHTCWYNHNGIDNDGQIATYEINNMSELSGLLVGLRSM